MIKDFEFYHNDDSAVITKYRGNSEIVKIPTQIDGKTVEFIGDKCFCGNEQIKAVILPKTIRQINSDCFSHCYNLRFVAMPNGLEKIMSEAFFNCKSLNHIAIPKSVKEIGTYAFFGTGYNHDEDGAFYINDCLLNLPVFASKENNSFSIKEGTRLIANKAFFECFSLSEIKIPDSVESIGAETFEKCFNLKSITIPKSVKFIGYQAFWFCQKLTDVYILNKECDMSSGNLTIPRETIIHGYAGSTAEAYAKKYNNKFEEVKL